MNINGCLGMYEVIYVAVFFKTNVCFGDFLECIKKPTSVAILFLGLEGAESACLAQRHAARFMQMPRCRYNAHERLTHPHTRTPRV